MCKVTDVPFILRVCPHSQCKSRVKVGSLVCESGSTITDNKHAVQLLNDYFSSVFTKEIMSTMPEAWRMFMGDDSPRKKLQSLKPDKATASCRSR